MPLPQPAADSTALVTGASSGIGREIARSLAERGHGVTLVARRADRLEELAAELRDRHGVRAEALPADLSAPDAPAEVLDEVAGRGLTVAVLVNNAGFGIYRAFAASDPDREREQLGVLVTAVVDLNARVFPQMVARRSGAIINVASTAGFQPLPGNGTYAAAKAYVLAHSEALHAEARGTGVTVTAVCPGPVRTEFQETSEPLFADNMPKLVWATPERVARDALRAADRGRRMVIPGGLPVRLFFGLNRVTPVAVSLPIAGRLMAKEVELGRQAPSVAVSTPSEASRA